MPKPKPTMGVFDKTDDFTKTATLDKFNQNIQKIGDKFGALVSEDFDTSSETTITFFGHVDGRGHQVTNASTIFQVGNIGVLSGGATNINSIISNQGSGIIFIPPNTSVLVTATIELDDGIQIIGSGPSSVLFASTIVGDGAGNVAFNMIHANNKARWALRDFRLVGKKVGGTTGKEAGVLVEHCRSSQSIIESVTFGPFVTSTASTNIIRGPGIDIDGSSDVTVTNCHIRQCDSTGINIRSSATSHCRDINITDNYIEQALVGIFMNDVSFITVMGNHIQDNEGTNIHMTNADDVIIADNHMHNASTNAIPAPTNNLEITGPGTGASRSMRSVIVENHFLDNGKRTTNYHVHMHTNSGSHVMYSNYFNSVTGSLQTIKIPTATIIARDANHMHESHYTIKSFNDVPLNYNIGNSVSGGGGADDFDFRAQWNEQGRIMDYESTHVEDMGSGDGLFRDNVGGPVDFSVDNSGLSPNSDGSSQDAARYSAAYWSPTGFKADARPAGLKKAIEEMANKGTPLTPANFVSGTTNLELELGSVQATYNIVQTDQPQSKSFLGGFQSQASITFPGNHMWASGNRVLVGPASPPVVERNVIIGLPKSWPRWFWTSTAGRFTGSPITHTHAATQTVRRAGGILDFRWMDFEEMGNSVLTADFNGDTTMIVTANADTAILDGRPTWVSFHL